MTAIKLCDSQNCTYCKACSSICGHDAISYSEDQYGFSYPHINTEKCISCGLCVKTCPILSPKIPPKQLIEVYAAYSKDHENVRSSSSGGLFFEFAKYVISCGGVVFGVVSDHGSFYHTSAESFGALDAMRGSKYVQSDMRDCLQAVKKELKSNRMVLFTGTPCQIAGLYSYLNKDYSQLLTCEVICHGVPSLKIFKRCMNLLHISENDYQKVSFRDMKVWNYVTTVIKKSGIKCRIFWKNDIYMKLFMKKYTYKKICYRCPFASLPRISDVTIGDFWGIKKTADFQYNNQGTSVLLVNSQKGKELLSKVSKNLEYTIKTMDEAVMNNPNIKYPTPEPTNREELLHDLFTFQYKNQIVRKYKLHLTLRNIVGYICRRIKSYYVH